MYLVSVSKRVHVRNLSYENEFDLHLNELVSKTHFHERFRTWTRFETEVNGTRKWPIKFSGRQPCSQKHGKCKMKYFLFRNYQAYKHAVHSWL